MRLADDLITTRVKAALGPAFDSKATYRVVRPAMVGLPKYANDKVVGEFTEDGRAGGKLIVLLRPAPPPPPPPKPVSAPTAADRVRNVLSGRKPPTR